MAVPVRLRGDFSSGQVRAFARYAKDADQVRRLLAIATILDGGSQSDAAKVGGVMLQIDRDWVLRFNAQGLEGLETRKAPGPNTILDDCHRCALADAIEAGPIPAVHGVVRWRVIDHCCHAWNRLIDQPWRIMSIGLRQWGMGRDQGVLV